jgi:hypothetical protein
MMSTMRTIRKTDGATMAITMVPPSFAELLASVSLAITMKG